MSVDIEILQHNIDTIAILCLDSGVAIGEIYLPIDLLAELKSRSFAYTHHGIYKSTHIPVDNILWRSAAGTVTLIPQLNKSRIFNINSSGMVSCDIDSAPTLLLLNKLLRLKIYDPSPV